MSNILPYKDIWVVQRLLLSNRSPLVIIIISNSLVPDNLKTRPTDTSETLSKYRYYIEDVQKYFLVEIALQIIS